MSNLSTLTPGTWNVDPSHSSVSFSVRHLMITKVRGSFRTFSGTVTIASDPLASTVDATVDMASVDTGDENRDGHLRTGDFFDVEHHPTMALRTAAIRQNGSNFVLDADLTIKGVTKRVAFNLEFEGSSKDPWGNTKAAFTASAEINRKDWGLEYNAVLETGGVLIGEQVQITLDIQVVKA
jgi:polyisoprenoid-binding protein YceI